MGTEKIIPKNFRNFLGFGTPPAGGKCERDKTEKRKVVGEKISHHKKYKVQQDIADLMFGVPDDLLY